MTCLEHSNRVIYSASIVNVDTNRCFLLIHDINPPPSINTYLMINFRLLLSAA